MTIMNDFEKIINERSIVTSFLTFFSVILSAFIIVALRVMEVISVWTASILTFSLPVAIYLIGALWLILDRWWMREEIEEAFKDVPSLPADVKLYLKRML